MKLRYFIIILIVVFAVCTSCKDDESGVFTDKNGREYVDLDLPSGTLWATRNLGRDSSSVSGDFYAWGELRGHSEGKTDFSWLNYKLCQGKDSTMTRYVMNDKWGTVDSMVTLTTDDDAAYALWGPEWQMPTTMQFSELMNTDNCTWRWTTSGGLKGYRVTSRRNGNSIFLPVSGYRENDELRKTDYGYYWTRSLNWSFSNQADYLFLKDNTIHTYGGKRYYGQSIRPVRVNGKYKNHDYFKPYI